MSGLFPSGLPSKIFYEFIISLMHITRSAHLNLLEKLKLLSITRFTVHGMHLKPVSNMNQN
jgi:hypothetical protein